MKQILAFTFIVSNLVEAALPIPFPINAAYNSVRYITDNCRAEDESAWSGKVTVNETKITGTSREGFTASALKQILDESYSLEFTTPKTLSWLWNIPNKITSTIRKSVRNAIRLLCSPIPEPILMPDLDLTRILTFQAFNGSISGVRQICERHGLFPISLTRRWFKVGLKYQLPLHGLHFQYHVIDKRLGVNHTFNWTLSRGSYGEMYLLGGFSFPCIVSIEDIDVRLNFSGFDGRRKCIGDCNTVLGKLQCYLYYSLRQAFGLLTEPLKQLTSKLFCLSFKRMGLQEAVK